MKSWMRPGALLLSTSLLFQTGCFSWDVVKPAELPKLNGSFTHAQQNGSVALVTLSVADLQRPDGSLVQVRGKADVKLFLRSGETLAFQNPVESSVEGDELVLRASNRGETRVRFDDLERAEVCQYSPTKSILLFLGAAIGTIALGIVTIAVVVSSSYHPQPAPP